MLVGMILIDLDKVRVKNLDKKYFNFRHVPFK